MQSTTSSTRTFISPPTASEPKANKPVVGRKLLSKKNLPWIIILVLLLVSLFFYVQYRDAQNKLADSGSNAQQIGSLVAKVRRLVVLPANETPTVATVTNAAKLHSQTFFANAQDGDKVLVYNSQKEAILYRPSTNQIVTIAPVTVSPNANNPAGQ